MRKLLFLVMVILLIAGAAFSQSSPSSTFRRDGDTSIARTNNVRVPVYLKVGKRPDDPFPTYIKTFLAADSVGAADSHYVVLSSWLSVPVASTALQHAIAAEIYYTAETDTMKQNLVGQEISVNVPGRLVFDRTTGHYGIYGLIVNGKPTTTNANGYMEGNRFVGIYIDLADVSVGQVDSVRMDTTIGLWIPSLDGGTTDSAFVKLSVWGKNNMRTDDSMLVADALILGVGGSDSSWVYPDSIKGIAQWITKGATVPVINTRSNTTETGMLRLYGDSAQIRILHTLGSTYMQLGDSAFTASDSFYVVGYNSTNLLKFEVRTNQFRYRNSGNVIVQLPNDTPVVNQVMKVTNVTGMTATMTFENESASSGLDSTTIEGYFMEKGGDTTTGTYDFSGGTLADVYLGTIQYLTTYAIDSASLVRGQPGLTMDVTAAGGSDLRFQYNNAGLTKFYLGALERLRIDYDSLKGLNRADIKDFIRGYIDSLIADRLYARTAAVDTLVGRDTGVPTLADPLDANNYVIRNIDSAIGSVADFDTYLNIVADSPFVFNITTSAAGTEYATTTRRIKARPGANVTFTREDSTSSNLWRIAVPEDSIWDGIEDSLNNVEYIYLKFQPESWDRPLADSLFVLGPHRIFKDTDSARAMLLMDSCSAISEPKADTVYLSVALPRAGSIDTVGIVYDCSSANNFITSISLIGPDRENGLNGCDSTYQTWTDDRDNTSFVYLPLDNADKTVQNGDVWGLRIIFNHAADNGQVRLGWARFAYRKTW